MAREDNIDQQIQETRPPAVLQVIPSLVSGGVERGTVDEIFDNPQEAYTQRLLSAIPSLDPAIQALLAQNRP